MGWLFTSKKEVRAFAQEKGFIVTDVERLLPTITGGTPQVDSLEKDTCARYAIQRGQSAGTEWSLLMRDASYGAQLPNGFLAEGNVTPKLLEKLKPLTEEFCEGYFEFEGVKGQVAVFWDEGGGKDDVDRLYDVLQSLADA